MTYSATVVADSMPANGVRLTTLEVVFPRVVLSEFNTHRAFSRNSASSRARSLKKTIDEVERNPYIPVFGREQRGMVAGKPIDKELFDHALGAYMRAHSSAVEQARELHRVGVHKGIVNRLLEPFMWHTVVVTATDWEGFFEQRLAVDQDGVPAADLPMFRIASHMKNALDASEPDFIRDDEYHLPYVSEDEESEYDQQKLIQLSIARCAGVSYLNQGTRRPVEQDLELFRRLRNAEPPHWSPFEHVAYPLLGKTRAHNLRGWRSYRHLLEKGNFSF